MMMVGNKYIHQQYQSGIGLIELMISMLIGLFIMAGVVQMFSTSSQNAVAAAGASRIQENIRYVFSRMSEDISQTGNLGCVSVSNNNVGDSADFIDNLLALDSANQQVNDFATIVNGADTATAATEPADEVALGTDTLQIRYVNHAFRIPLAAAGVEGASFVLVDSTDADFNRLTQFQVVAVTNCSAAGVFMVTNDPATDPGTVAGSAFVRFDTGVTAPAGGINPGQSNRKNTINQSEQFIANDGTGVNDSSVTYLYGGSTGSYIYYIGDAVAATGTCDSVARPQNCALFRFENGRAQELVQGVHDMQVQYGWTDATGQLFYAGANNAAIDWDRVDRVRVDVSFNSIDNVITTGNTIDTTVTGLITRQMTRTFNLANQL